MPQSLFIKKNLFYKFVSFSTQKSYIDNVSTIGVYDSGIGGLTTLCALLDNFSGNNFFYYADNAHHPFGTKNVKELKEIVENAVCKMKNRADYVILACNTASTIYDKDDVYKLLPPIQEFSQEDTLLMATPTTLENCNWTKCAHTASLASQIEIQASIGHVKNSIDMSALYTYLRIRLFKFKGVKNVILGCSHYPYCKKEISKILGDVRYADGNENLIKRLSTQCRKTDKISKITFEFSGQNEESKYRKILSVLTCQNAH